MKKTVTLTSQMQFSYSEKSKEFKNSIKSFDKYIGGGGVNDMLSHCCHNIIHFGIETMVEGVGYIKPKHKKWSEVPEPHSGIALLSDDFVSFDYEHE